MFAILLPVSLSPLIITLLWAERKTKKLGLIEADLQGAMHETTSSDDTLLRRLRRMATQLDLVGLILLGTAISLVLLPLTLSQTVKGQWKNGNFGLLAVGYWSKMAQFQSFRCSPSGLCFFSYSLIGISVLQRSQSSLRAF